MPVVFADVEGGEEVLRHGTDVADGSHLRFVIPGSDGQGQHAGEKLKLIHRRKVVFHIAVADRGPGAAAGSHLNTRHLGAWTNGADLEAGYEFHPAGGTGEKLVCGNSVQRRTVAIRPYKCAELVIGAGAATRSKAEGSAGNIGPAAGHSGLVAAGGVGIASAHDGKRATNGVGIASAQGGQVSAGGVGIATAHGGIIADGGVVRASAHGRKEAAGGVGIATAHGGIIADGGVVLASAHGGITTAGGVAVSSAHTAKAATYGVRKAGCAAARDRGPGNSSSRNCISAKTPNKVRTET